MDVARSIVSMMEPDALRWELSEGQAAMEDMLTGYMEACEEFNQSKHEWSAIAHIQGSNTTERGRIIVQQYYGRKENMEALLEDIKIKSSDWHQRVKRFGQGFWELSERIPIMNASDTSISAEESRRVTRV